MSHDFNSFGDFGNFLDSIVKTRLAEIPALELAAQVVEKEAKEEIGKYQRTNVGPFAPWEELKNITKKERREKGFTENEPLLRSGDLQNSISHVTDASGNEAVIGSTLQKAVYLELGTKYMAPRSVLGLAAWRSRKKIIRIVGGLTVSAFANVDFDTTGLTLKGVTGSIFEHKE